MTLKICHQNSDIEKPLLKIRHFLNKKTDIKESVIKKLTSKSVIKKSVIKNLSFKNLSLKICH